MKGWVFVGGIAAGMAMATAALTGMYPDITRRMARDGKRVVKCGKKAASQISGIFS